MKRKEHWKPADEGVVKINTDASFFSQLMAGGTRLIVRDHRGAMIRAQALWHEDTANELTMEARSICEGARAAMERGLIRVKCIYNF